MISSCVSRYVIRGLKTGFLVEFSYLFLPVFLFLHALPLLDSARRVLSRLVFTKPQSLINKFLVIQAMDCRRGYRRVNLCIREDLVRALVILQAGSGLARWQVVNEALEIYLLNYDLIAKIGKDRVRLALEGCLRT